MNVKEDTGSFPKNESRFPEAYHPAEMVVIKTCSLVGNALLTVNFLSFVGDSLPASTL